MIVSLSLLCRQTATAIGGASANDRREAVPLLIQGIAAAILEERGADTAALTMQDISRIALETADRVTGYEEG